MIGSYADALQVTGAAGPWLALALVLLGIASRVARSARASARRQGERIGALELRADSERLRRRQVEAHLQGLGIRLPWWPADGRPQYDPAPAPAEDFPVSSAAGGPRNRKSSGQAAYREDEEDQGEEYWDGPDDTTVSPRVPPLPGFPQHRRSHSA